MKFREHGTGKPVLQFKDRAALQAYMREQFAPFPDLDQIPLAKIRTEPYFVSKTASAGWWNGKVYLVTVPQYGVLGYADEPL